MFWNIFVHILIGLLGTQHFTVTPKGILFTLFIVSLTQGSELIRYYMDKKRKIEVGSVEKQKTKMEAFKKDLSKELSGIFAQNVVMYSAIVLLSSGVGRNSGYGL